MIAPFVQSLSAWHQQAARLMLEVDRAASRGEPATTALSAMRELIEQIQRERDAFTHKTAALASSRVEDVEKSFGRLLSDLKSLQSRSGEAPMLQQRSTR